MNPRRILTTSALILGTLILSIGIQAFAYTAPSVAPPGGDAAAPLNTHSVNQTKAVSTTAGQLGQLTLNGTLQVMNQNIANLGLYVANGRIQVGVGTGSTLNTKLAVFGNTGVVGGAIRLVDGTQGVGKVLTSDATGLASWATPAANQDLCRGSANCATLPNGAVMQWGQESNPSIFYSASGSGPDRWAGSVGLPVWYRFGIYTLTVTRSLGNINAPYRTECEPEYSSSGQASFEYLVRSSTCTFPIRYNWQTIGYPELTQ